MCKCCLDEASRWSIGISASILSSIISFIGICFIFVAIYIKYQIEDKILLFGTYDGGILTSVIIIVGCIVLFTNLLVAKAVFDCSYIETRSRFKKLLMLCLVLLSLVCLLLFVCSMLCYTHKYVINRALKKGMETAMKRYRSHRNIKAAIDTLQIEFMCCGSQSYKDWFQTSWIPARYLKLDDVNVKGKMVNGLYITDDVPFSCCDVSSHRPCIHHQVSDKQAHFNYRRITLYPNGCKDTLKLHFHDTILMPTGHAFLVLLAIQIVSMTLLRLLQTSIFSALNAGDAEGAGYAFCCEYWPCQNKPMEEGVGLSGAGGGDYVGGGEMGGMPELPQMPDMPTMPEFGGEAGGGKDKKTKEGKGDKAGGKDKGSKGKEKGGKGKDSTGKKAGKTSGDGKKAGTGKSTGQKSSSKAGAAKKTGAGATKKSGAGKKPGVAKKPKAVGAKKVKTGKKAGGKKMGKKK